MNRWRSIFTVKYGADTFWGFCIVHLQAEYSLVSTTSVPGGENCHSGVIVFQFSAVLSRNKMLSAWHGWVSTNNLRDYFGNTPLTFPLFFYNFNCLTYAEHSPMQNFLFIACKYCAPFGKHRSR
jgi:hypothetical protein